MAVFNGERHLREAVTGILAQGFESFEFVIVDDGSTDDTTRILEEFSDPRIIRIRHPENRGLIAALNTGLAACRGEFIARQDADDLSHPDRLLTQVQWLRSRPDVAVLGSDSIFESPEAKRTVRSVETDPTRIGWILLFYCPLTHSSIMFRRKQIETLGGYGVGDIFAEDFGLWSRAARESRVASIDRALVVRRRPPESITERHGRDMAAAARRISLENLKWVAGPAVSMDDLDALQAFCSNRPLHLAEALNYGRRLVRRMPWVAQLVVDSFCEKTKATAKTSFQGWVLRWIGEAFLRRSRQILNESRMCVGQQRQEGRRLARSLSLAALNMSPAAVLSRPRVGTFLRGIAGRG